MTEQEIEKKLEQFKSGLELFKAKLDDARNTIGARDAQIEDIEKDKKVLQELCEERSEEIERLKKENENVQDYQQDNIVLQNLNSSQKEKIEKLEADLEDANKDIDEITEMYNGRKEYLDKQNKEIEKLKNEMAELEEAAEINKQVEALDQLRDEAQKAKENSDELYTENGRLKAQIASMELSYQELDLAKAGLEDKLEKEKAKNKSIAEESLSNKTDIDKERTKLSKKIDELKKELKNTKALLDSKSAEYSSLQKDYEALQVSYNKEKSKVYELREQATHSIVSLPANDETITNKAIHQYRLGPCSESVMNKFIQVIRLIYKDARKEDDFYILAPIEEKSKELKISQSDTSVIKTRLLSMKSPNGTDLLIEEAGQLKSKTNCEDFIDWISQVKENK